MLLALQSLTLPAPETGALVLSGLAFPVRPTGDRGVELVGEYGRAMQLGFAPDVRAEKGTWSFETAPLTQARAEQLRALARAYAFFATGALVGGVTRTVCLELGSAQLVRVAGGAAREVIQFTLREV